ncbi:MAG: 50S ribosomal protein L15 [Lactobacillales bacterium]|jgi:large subunit ribosomal protein L15|nr:50S ribosomal protein L15 [Lactobacillales bacterium]
MKLNTIRDNKGARKSLMRVCRGVGSGKGRFGGRGLKGQKSRTGVAVNAFEGGQMPIYRRLPKRGFTNIFKKTFAVINLVDLQKAIDDKVIDAAKEINDVSLMEAGLIKSAKDGLRLLGTGELKSKITVRVWGASKTAQAAVEKAGGEVIIAAKPKTVLEKGKKTSKKEAKGPKSKTAKPAQKAPAKKAK